MAELTVLQARVMVPTPEYLLAMKCLAMRIEREDGTHDLADILTCAHGAHWTDHRRSAD